MAIDIEEYRAVHLTAQADSPHVGSAELALRQDVADGLDRCLPPELKVLLDQPGRGWLHGYSAVALARIVPRSSISTDLVPDVPTSMPRATLTAKPSHWALKSLSSDSTAKGW